VCTKKLTDYLAAVSATLQTEAGFHDIYRVAVARRKQMVDTMPIAEFGLLFPVSTAEDSPVVLRADATVTVRA
jgi:ribosomal protein S16